MVQLTALVFTKKNSFAKKSECGQMNVCRRISHKYFLLFSTDTHLYTFYRHFGAIWKILASKFSSTKWLSKTKYKTNSSTKQNYDDVDKSYH